MRGKRVLDFGAGSGLVAMAAAKAGALATAAEIDPFAQRRDPPQRRASTASTSRSRPATSSAATRAPWEVVLAGDMCYERPLAERLTAWLRALAARGVAVLLGDPGRAYLPKDGLEQLARYTVPTTLELEDRTSREGVVWRLRP